MTRLPKGRGRRGEERRRKGLLPEMEGVRRSISI